MNIKDILDLSVEVDNKCVLVLIDDDGETILKNMYCVDELGVYLIMTMAHPKTKYLDIEFAKFVHKWISTVVKPEMSKF